jgi:hypothetical protein
LAVATPFQDEYNYHPKKLGGDISMVPNSLGKFQKHPPVVSRILVSRPRLGVLLEPHPV